MLEVKDFHVDGFYPKCLVPENRSCASAVGHQSSTTASYSNVPKLLGLENSSKDSIWFLVPAQDKYQEDLMVLEGGDNTIVLCATKATPSCVNVFLKRL